MAAEKGKLIKLGGSLPFNTTGEIEFDSTSSIEEARQSISSHTHPHNHNNDYSKRRHIHSSGNVVEETPSCLGMLFIFLVYIVIGTIVIMWFLAVTSHVWDELVELFQELLVLLGI